MKERIASRREREAAFPLLAFAAEKRRGGRAGWRACARRRNFKGTAVEFVRSIIRPVRAIMLKIASSLVASLPPRPSVVPAIWVASFL